MEQTHGIINLSASVYQNPTAWRVMVQRAQVLDITEEMLQSCQNLGDIKALVKTQHRLMVRYYHPDTAHQYPSRIKRRGMGLTNQYKKMTATYRWFLALTEEQYRRALLVRKVVYEAELEPLDQVYPGYRITRCP